MRFSSFGALGLLSLSAGFVAAASTPGTGVCTIKASGAGKDDAPNLISAIMDTACSTVEIPTGTTLNISTKMDATGAKNTHIVRVCFD